VKGIQVCPNKRPDPLQRGYNYKKIQKGGSFNNLLLQNHRANFNLGLGINIRWGRGFKFVQSKGIVLLQVEVIAKE
jgi:hypothetical protein